MPPSILNSRKASSISLLVNFSPQVISEWRNISASIWPLISKASNDLNNNVVIVGTSGHLLCEEGDHLGEVDGARRLAHHVVRLGVADGAADALEGLLEVGGSDDAVLVVVDDAEGLLELLDLLLAEQGEDV